MIVDNKDETDNCRKSLVELIVDNKNKMKSYKFRNNIKYKKLVDS